MRVFIKSLVLFAIVQIGSQLAFSQNLIKYDLKWGEKIPMRDGVKLNATLYLPKDLKEKQPVIIDLTPYISDGYHARGKYFAENGFIYAIVDCRGRGSSEGNFNPFIQEAKDGYDLVEYFAKQPYCNEKVAMWGGSYSGYNQWATAKEFPPHLSTIVPVASVFPGIDYPNPNNIFMSYMIAWLTYTSGKTGNSTLFGDDSFWLNKYADMYQKHLPFEQLDKIVGNETTVFQTWLAHPTYDDYWKSMNPKIEDYQKMNIPILTITGHYDADQQGALTFYENFMKYASAEAKNKHFLIIGPYNHSGTRTPKEAFGGLKFGKESMLDMNKLHKEWYEYTMKNGPKPSFLKDKVAYYVMEDEKWKYVESLEKIATHQKSLFLDSDGNANDVLSGAKLSENIANKSSTDKIVYNPLDISKGLENWKNEEPNYLKDQFTAYRLGNEAVIYHSAPFEDSTEISGGIEAKLYISTDVPDTDLMISLYELTTKGEAIYLTSDQLRLRYRESLERETLMQAGKVYECVFDDFRFFSKKIAKSSRLRLIIKTNNSLENQKNYNSGGNVSAETAKDSKIAHINIHHDAKFQSRIILPIVKNQP
ncbi:MAG: CocE/NonD family hydrolase [Emticicia sp.]|uniref:CocE/NonD family hydrolase n=1 Tax=Emticicia sp. TaxID=1930953 RepID=UPI003BA3E4AB